ncbi:hypothetical protein GJV85_12080 [Sulfurimonas aquatica]|uniref:Flagellar FliJ protein n=2 Tax=Sulfurimonas aquatica TaxID=2672570 RepID=A0A975B2N6_9BACT|nr:hypothetical protein GJV85_12080 [Sulfurimonas aquatica]
MQKSERVLESANNNLKNAQEALESSYTQLQNIHTPKSGTISEFLSSRTLLDSQRSLIKHNEEWVDFAKNEIRAAKERLKLDMIEFEKFNYLDVQEIKMMIKLQKVKESKELDDIALITYDNKRNIEEAS